MMRLTNLSITGFLILLNVFLSVAYAQDRPVYPKMVFRGYALQYYIDGKYYFFDTPRQAYEAAKTELLKSSSYRDTVFLELNPGEWPLIDRWFNGVPNKYFATTVNRDGVRGLHEIVYPSWECPEGTKEKEAYVNPYPEIRPTYRTITCIPEPKPDLCENGCNEHVGDPIYYATGVEQMYVNDYQGVGANELSFIRRYRSDRIGWSHNHLSVGFDLTNPPSGEEGSLYNACFKGTSTI